MPVIASLEIDDRRQHVVRHDDRLGGVASHVPIARHDDGDRLAAIPDGVDRNRSMLRRREWSADRHRRQQFGDLRAGKDRFDAFHRLRCTRIDGDDASVGHVAALEDDVLHADQRDVVDIGRRGPE